ncbi:hypothetical protein HDU96_010297 [Phlyctochytrium bullatum]|nr:hypothetical protein HDU96_010297 [Phlyctochytrium bullatum]
MRNDDACSATLAPSITSDTSSQPSASATTLASATSIPITICPYDCRHRTHLHAPCTHHPHHAHPAPVKPHDTPEPDPTVPSLPTVVPIASRRPSVLATEAEGTATSPVSGNVTKCLPDAVPGSPDDTTPPPRSTVASRRGSLNPVVDASPATLSVPTQGPLPITPMDGTTVSEPPTDFPQRQGPLPLTPMETHSHSSAVVSAMQSWKPFEQAGVSSSSPLALASQSADEDDDDDDDNDGQKAFPVLHRTFPVMVAATPPPSPPSRPLPWDTPHPDRRAFPPAFPSSAYYPSDPDVLPWHTSWIDDGMVGGMSAPVERVHWRTMAALGVGLVVNLTEAPVSPSPRAAVRAAQAAAAAAARARRAEAAAGRWRGGGVLANGWRDRDDDGEDEDEGGNGWEIEEAVTGGGVGFGDFNICDDCKCNFFDLALRFSNQVHIRSPQTTGGFVDECCDDDIFDDIPPSSDLQVLFLPIPDGSIPSFHQLKTFCREASACIRRGRRVAVHCQAGVGRTGLFLAVYLMEKYLCGPHEALDRLRSVRPQSLQFHPTDWQTEPFEMHGDPKKYQRNLLQERFLERYWDFFLSQECSSTRPKLWRHDGRLDPVVAARLLMPGHPATGDAAAAYRRGIPFPRAELAACLADPEEVLRLLAFHPRPPTGFEHSDAMLGLIDAQLDQRMAGANRLRGGELDVVEAATVCRVPAGWGGKGGGRRRRKGRARKAGKRRASVAVGHSEGAQQQATPIKRWAKKLSVVSVASAPDVIETGARSGKVTDLEEEEEERADVVDHATVAAAATAAAAAALAAAAAAAASRTPSVSSSVESASTLETLALLRPAFGQEAAEEEDEGTGATLSEHEAQLAPDAVDIPESDAVAGDEDADDASAEKESVSDTFEVAMAKAAAARRSLAMMSGSGSADAAVESENSDDEFDEVYGYANAHGYGFCEDEEADAGRAGFGGRRWEEEKGRTFGLMEVSDSEDEDEGEEEADGFEDEGFDEEEDDEDELEDDDDEATLASNSYRSRGAFGYGGKAQATETAGAFAPSYCMTGSSSSQAFVLPAVTGLMDRRHSASPPPFLCYVCRGVSVVGPEPVAPRRVWPAPAPLFGAGNLAPAGLMFRRQPQQQPQQQRWAATAPADSAAASRVAASGGAQRESGPAASQVSHFGPSTTGIAAAVPTTKYVGFPHAAPPASSATPSEVDADLVPRSLALGGVEDEGALAAGWGDVSLSSVGEGAQEEDASAAAMLSLRRRLEAHQRRVLDAAAGTGEEGLERKTVRHDSKLDLGSAGSVEEVLEPFRAIEGLEQNPWVPASAGVREE